MVLVLLLSFLGLLNLLTAAAVGIRPKFLQGHFPVCKERSAMRAVAALLALIAAVAAAAAIAVPFLAFFAACLTILTSAGTWWVLSYSKAARSWPVPAAMAFASIAVALLQPLGLKVMLLPKADQLPYQPVEAHVVKTYGEGVWFESVRAGADGTLYLAANLGLDFSRSDYYRHAHGEVIARHPDGREDIRFTTPVGCAAGVFAVAPDGTLYMSSNGIVAGIWKISPNGSGERMTTLPRGAWPNGLDFGPDGMLYAPDSALGLVWRVDPKTGRFEKALVDKRLSAPPFISLAPGANGLHFRGRDMIVTVSDATTVLSYRLEDDGHFGSPVALAKGIPGDDFAIGKDGSLFITTHPYNTLVRVKPNGERVIIGDARQHIVGATDAVFGRGPDDQDTLYVATDGGAFTGGAKTRGQLVALRPYASK